MLVTSLTEKLYHKYGKTFIDSFREMWPKKVHLTIYWEGNDLREDEENIHWRYIEEVEGLCKWMDAIHNFPLMEGKTPNGYDIQHDARHVRKALIEMHALKVFGGRVFWADSDIVTHRPVPHNWLELLLPDDKLCCYAGREGWMYPETGFIGFNANHPLYEPFVSAYREVFTSGLIFTQRGWHDCYGFDLARYALGQPDAFIDYAKDLPQGTMHPVINTVFGDYLDHKKGPRKAEGSTKADLVIEREESYWQNAKAS